MVARISENIFASSSVKVSVSINRCSVADILKLIGHVGLSLNLVTAVP